MNSKAAFFAISCYLLFAEGTAAAAVQTVAAQMRFETVLIVAKAADMNFGLLKASQAGSYTLSPSGAVTAANDGVWLGGAPQAASLTITGSATQTIGISAVNYVANNGVTPSNATCAYDGGATQSCNQASLAAPGTGKELKVGVTVVVDGSQAISSTAAPTFDLVVSYN